MNTAEADLDEQIDNQKAVSAGQSGSRSHRFM